MKKLLVALGLLFSAATFAQQANVWHFGYKAGLDFNGVNPVAISSSINTDEGCASICDQSGNPLFYTDGTKVWNGAGTLITSALHGGKSSTQSAIIVPRPGTSNYYIFTLDDQYHQPTQHGLKYSEVMVSGSTVTMGSINNPLIGHSHTTEKVTAACHSNGTDYWVTTVKQNGDFVSYQVSNSGVGGAVLSSVSALPVSSYKDDRVGYMKISNQGDKLILGRRHSGSKSEFFKYNSSTGKVTANNGIYHTGTVYGVEFSENGDYFFTTESFKRVYQYNATTLQKTLLHTAPSSSSHRVGALQMGPDGNIYVANGYEGNNGLYLDRIINTNSGAPTYQDNVITLASGTYSRLGLPDVVACFVPVQGCGLESKANYAVSPTNCYSYQFEDISTANNSTQIVSWSWTFGDGYSSTDQNPVHNYAASGNYTVCLEIVGFDGNECCTDKICFEVSVRDCELEECHTEPMFKMVEDPTSVCNYIFTGYAFNSTRNVLAYIWDFGDGTTAVGEEVVKNYNTTGNFTVCLKVLLEGDNGECCVFEYCEDVKIQRACSDADSMKANESDSESNDKTNSDVERTNSTKVYPNPATNELNVQMNIEVSGEFTFRVIDLMGKVYQTEKRDYLDKGWNSLQINTTELVTGTYFLLISNGKDTSHQKFQILK